MFLLALAQALLVLSVARATTDDTDSSVEKVSAAWYAGWHAGPGNFSLDKVPWDMYTHLTYSFAITTPDVTQLSLEGSLPEFLPAFVHTAQKNGVKALVSVGGWTGCLYYSSMVGSAENRTAFVKTITEFATKFKLDGIDFDWESPGSQGIGCNVVSPQDTTNLLSFLQELRQDPVGKKLFLTAATGVIPWNGPDGNPLTDVSGFAKVLDYIAIMNYDVNGPWSSVVAANAPLNDTCAPPAFQSGSAVRGVQVWTQAGMPLHQIVLGVASYGHSFHVSPQNAFNNKSEVLASYPPFDADLQPAGDRWDDQPGLDVCGNLQGFGGDWDFWGLVEGGFLNTKGTVADGISYRYDECSQTPYVYNETSEVMVSYDDARSFAVKGEFIKSNKLRGFAIWEAGGDFHNILLSSIRNAAGFSAH